MSNKTNEFSKGGQPIYRHERTSDFQRPSGFNCAIEEIIQHFEKHIGKVENVFHEIVSDLVHIDVHFINPTIDREYYTLFTTGMSDLRMSVPSGAEEFRYAELMMCLPKNWLFSDKDFKNEKNYWPIRWLKSLARLPHEYNTWLGFGHTIPNGDPAKPFSRDTKLCGMMLSTPTIVKEINEFKKFEVNYLKQINLYSVLPVYKEEMDFKLSTGAEDLLYKFEENNINEILNLDRVNVCEKKKRFLFF